MLYNTRGVITTDVDGAVRQGHAKKLGLKRRFSPSSSPFPSLPRLVVSQVCNFVPFPPPITVLLPPLPPLQVAEYWLALAGSLVSLTRLASFLLTTATKTNLILFFLFTISFF